MSLRHLLGFTLLLGLSARAQETLPAPKLFTYKTAGEIELKAHVFQPRAAIREPRPAILLFHGGGWTSGEASWVYPSARRFSELGMVAVAIDYRLSDEKNVTPLEALEDARDAMRWVRGQASALNLDPRRVAVHGVSAGGHLAAGTALVPSPGGKVDPACVPNAVLLYSPAIALANDGYTRSLLLGKVPPQAISPDQFIRPGLPPMLINQGQEDSVTPFSGAIRFSRALQSAGNVCEFRRFSGLGHLLTRNLDEQEWAFDPDPVARADAWRAEEAFLARLGFLPPQPPRVESPEAVVRAYVAALGAGKVEAALAWCAEEALAFHVEDGPPQPGIGRGPLKSRLEATVKDMPGWHAELHMLSTNGAFVSARERAIWNADGREHTRNTMVVFEVKEGRIRRMWRFPAQP